MTQKNNYWICKHIPSEAPETLEGFHYLKDAKERARELFAETNDNGLFIVNMEWRGFDFR